MFSWFKKKAAPRSEGVPEIAKQFIMPMQLALALAKTISKYSQSVKSGKKSSPAYQREDDSVVGIWNDTRLEALRHLWGYGASDVTLLADHTKQVMVLNTFFQEKPQFEFPHQPSGEPIHDTLQALFQIYIFLGEVGSAVHDNETDSVSLKLKDRTIFSDFEEQANSLRQSWLAFARDLQQKKKNLSESLPSTILEVLYQDVTKKTKSIAFSAQIGPLYQDGLKRLLNSVEKKMRERGDSEKSIRREIQQCESTMQMILEADDPDHIN